MKLKRIVQAMVALMLLGVAKLPLEERVTQRLRAAHLLSEPLTLDVRENVGQMSFAAALGGLRSLVASVLYLEAYTAFENVDWAKVDSLFQLVTRMQPRSALYWEQASSHMAYDAAGYYLRSEEIEAAVRGRLFEEHVRRGIEILEEGLTYLPGNARLWNRLGDIFKTRTKDSKRAAEAYLKAFESGGQPYLQRAAAYELASLPDEASRRRAYELLKIRYAAGDRYPTVITKIKEFEQMFGVPLAVRIPEARPVIPETAPGMDAGPNEDVK